MKIRKIINLKSFQIFTILLLSNYCFSPYYFSLMFLFTSFHTFYINTSHVKIKNNNFFSKYFPKYDLEKIPKIRKKDELIINFNNLNTSLIDKLKIRFFYNIRIMYNNFDKLPIENLYCWRMVIKNIKNNLPYMRNNKIRELILDNNIITKIDLSNFPEKIGYLSVNCCSLKKISMQPNYLKFLHLKDNYLEDVTIYGNFLEKADLSYNILIKFEISAPNLKSLNLSNNNLETIILKNVNLEDLELDLTRNQFVVLPTDIINVKSLLLDNNPIIPNLNVYKWCEYFDKYYPQFFQNNLDMPVQNVYQDKESVHNPYINNSVQNCLRELYSVYCENRDEINKSRIYSKILREIDHHSYEIICLMDNTSLGIDLEHEVYISQILSAIFFLAKQNNVLEIIKEILVDEIHDGFNYCFSGKVGRIITSIMGFNLIKSVVSISRNEEIMIKYDIVKNRLIKENMDVKSDEFIVKLRNELMNEFVLMGLSKEELDIWIDKN